MMPGRQGGLFGRRMGSARILVFGGILLIILGMALGEIYAIFISHVGAAEVRQRWVAVVEHIAERQPERAAAEFAAIQQMLVRRGRIVNAHSHIVAFGFLALTFALLQPLLPFSESSKDTLAWSTVAGGCLQAGFVFISGWVGLWANILSDLGMVLVLVGAIGTLRGLVRAQGLRETLEKQMRTLLQPPSSSLLLRAGGLLVILGMVFGFYYAWVFVTEHEPAQFNLLEAGLSSAMAGNVEDASDIILQYRRLQPKIAITVAAHSHAIEMGTMAILLAFIQPFLYLDERWRWRWAWVFIVGSFLMPLFVFLAPRVGLFSAAFADLSGFLALLALSAMLVGAVRGAAVQDVSGGHA